MHNNNIDLHTKSYYNFFCSAANFPSIIYARGAAIKIDDIVPANTHTQTVKANSFITPVPKAYIAMITRNVDIDVPIDLLIVCRILSSNSFP
jgi:hypothetical protein